MDSYLVTFTFDVDSDSPEHAAADAIGMFRDPGAYPPIATVRGTRGPEVDVDLAAITENES